MDLCRSIFDQDDQVKLPFIKKARFSFDLTVIKSTKAIILDCI